MEKKILKILVKPSISEEALENWIWIYNLDNLPKGFIKIKNTINKKSMLYPFSRQKSQRFKIGF